MNQKKMKITKKKKIPENQLINKSEVKKPILKTIKKGWSITPTFSSSQTY
jgi:DNA-directed RNA polymerase subunit H (RpoH/RPB5)